MQRGLEIAPCQTEGAWVMEKLNLIGSTIKKNQK